uniref:Uncharacterized protein n=1 Tax=Rhizophora mucronata TaxID=61149 RepID=A0A2P2P2E8_RHIMU
MNNIKGYKAYLMAKNIYTIQGVSCFYKPQGLYLIHLTLTIVVHLDLELHKLYEKVVSCVKN